MKSIKNFNGKYMKAYKRICENCVYIYSHNSIFISHNFILYILKKNIVISALFYTEIFKFRSSLI